MSQTDDRVRKLIAKKKAVDDAAKRKQIEAEAATDAERDRILSLEAKWKADQVLIKAAIDRLNRDLQEIGVSFSYKDRPGNPGTTIATSEFQAKGPNGSKRLALNVFEIGEVRVYLDGTQTGSKFDLMLASQQTYDDLLLDVADRLIS